MTQDDKKSALLSYVKENKRICPQPRYWNELWKMLSDKKHIFMEACSSPLILNAWHFSSDEDKSQRLIEHIEYADKIGSLDLVDKYLRNLHATEWYHSDDCV